MKKYYFTCNRWLARSEDDGEIVRELIATDENGVPISSAEGEPLSWLFSLFPLFLNSKVGSSETLTMILVQFYFIRL